MIARIDAKNAAFSDEPLVGPQTLYPAHGAYVRAVIGDVLNLVAQRDVTFADGLKLIQEAQTSSIP